MSKYFEETVRLQSEIRREWIREIRGERLQGIAEGASSAPRLASSSAVSFPGRNECPGTHCSLIEQEEKKDSSCTKKVDTIVLRLIESRSLFLETGWKLELQKHLLVSRRIMKYATHSCTIRCCYICGATTSGITFEKSLIFDCV